MENQISYLKNENNLNKWEGIKKMLSDKHEEYKKRIPEPENNDISIDINFGDIDVKNMTVQQAIDYGDKILEDYNKRIKNIIKTLNGDFETMKKVNEELERQKKVLENTINDLKNIDYSLKRAGQQIRNMFKILANDKLIVCFIVVIILVILAIIIASIAGKKKDNSNENLPHDIFSKKNSNRKLKFLWDFH